MSRRRGVAKVGRAAVTSHGDGQWRGGADRHAPSHGPGPEPARLPPPCLALSIPRPKYPWAGPGGRRRVGCGGCGRVGGLRWMIEWVHDSAFDTAHRWLDNIKPSTPQGHFALDSADKVLHTCVSQLSLISQLSHLRRQTSLYPILPLPYFALLRPRTRHHNHGA